ncbi:MAG: prepilin-type N-terminal cleavage/methylation domain-containing protein [Phycisphaerales bacterium]
MKKGFTLTELLVAIGLLAGVLTASAMIFHYSIEAQRTAMATSEIMRTLRAITDQLNSNLSGLKTDGYLLLYSYQPNIGRDANHSDALYFFSEGDFQSSQEDDLRSNTARIYFGPSKNSPNDLLLDIKLLTPNQSVKDPNDDFKQMSFVECQEKISLLEGKDPNEILSYNGSRPLFDANIPSNLLAQRVTGLTIDWAYKREKWTTGATQIQWHPEVGPIGKTFEQSGNPYKAKWTPRNQNDWPEAIRFRFTLYDSKGIIKNGKTFEHIVYIGK